MTDYTRQAVAALLALGFRLRVDGDALEVSGGRTDLTAAQWDGLAVMKPRIIAVLQTLCSSTMTRRPCSPEGLCTTCPGVGSLLAAYDLSADDWRYQ